MTKRYNHKGEPKEMEECATGYWVTYEDYNIRELDHSKEIEKSYLAYCRELGKVKDGNTDDNIKTIDNLRTTVIIMSVVIFGGLAAFIFSWV